MSTLAEEQQAGAVSLRECSALRLLHEGGLDAGELAFMFERQEQTIRRHIECDCNHSRPVPAGSDLWAEARAALEAADIVVEARNPRRLRALGYKLLSLGKRAQARGER